MKRAGAFTPRPSLASGFVFSPALTTTLHLPSRGSGLVDLLIARSRVRGANLDRRANLLELQVTAISIEPVETVEEEAEVIKEEALTIKVVEVVLLLSTKLGDVRHVLGIAGVSHTLHSYALVRVVTRLGDVKGLVYVPALCILLDVLVQVAIEVKALEVLEVVIEEAVEEEAVEEEFLLAVIPAVVPAIISVIR